jgi:hypothetical protein
MKRTLLLAAAVPLIVLPGLMSGAAAAAVPTAAATSTSPATDPEPPVDLAKSLDDFVSCLKDHGVDVARPAPGRPLLVEAGPGEDAKRTAIEACVPDLPRPSEAAGGNPDELKPFARCMRENGVPGFPDPDERGLVLRQDEAGSDPHPGDPAFDSAQQACQDELPAPVAGGAPGSVVFGGTGIGGVDSGPGIGVGIAVAGESAPAGVAVHIGRAG